MIEEARVRQMTTSMDNARFIIPSWAALRMSSRRRGESRNGIPGEMSKLCNVTKGDGAVVPAVDEIPLPEAKRGNRAEYHSQITEHFLPRVSEGHHLQNAISRILWSTEGAIRSYRPLVSAMLIALSQMRRQDWRMCQLGISLILWI